MADGPPAEKSAKTRQSPISEGIGGAFASSGRNLCWKPQQQIVNAPRYFRIIGLHCRERMILPGDLIHGLGDH